MSFTRQLKDIDRGKLIVIKSTTQFPKSDIEFLSAYGYIMTKEMYSNMWVYLSSELMLIRCKSQDPLNPNQMIVW